MRSKNYHSLNIKMPKIISLHLKIKQEHITNAVPRANLASKKKITKLTLQCFLLHKALNSRFLVHFLHICLLQNRLTDTWHFRLMQNTLRSNEPPEYTNMEKSCTSRARDPVRGTDFQLLLLFQLLIIENFLFIFSKYYF